MVVIEFLEKVDPTLLVFGMLSLWFLLRVVRMLKAIQDLQMRLNLRSEERETRREYEAHFKKGEPGSDADVVAAAEAWFDDKKNSKEKLREAIQARRGILPKLPGVF